MTEQIVRVPVIRHAGEGDKRWFFGGGVFTIKASAADTAGGFLLWEDTMERGKVTPLHTHPTDEAFYVLDGEILLHVDGEDTKIGDGGFALAPRSVPHAFMVLSESCRLLCLHTPGNSEGFYLGASEPLEGSTQQVDFGRIAEAGQLNGGFTLLGPPPFAPA